MEIVATDTRERVLIKEEVNLRSRYDVSVGCHLLSHLLIVTIPEVETREEQNQGVTTSSCACRGGGYENGLWGGRVGKAGCGGGRALGLILLRC